MGEEEDGPIGEKSEEIRKRENAFTGVAIVVEIKECKRAIDFQFFLVRL